MTLGEKILELRAARGLSQGDLAEQLEVSRQSVSKWETGQSVPDLDKLIKLADLFGVTVDELVRDGERPQPTQPEPQVIYVERRARFTAAHVVGVLLEAAGLILGAIALLFEPGAVIFAVIQILAGLPLLLSKDHPWIFFGWTATLMLYLLSLLFTGPLYFGPAALYYMLCGVMTTSSLLAVIRMALLLVMFALSERAWQKDRRAAADD